MKHSLLFGLLFSLTACGSAPTESQTAGAPPADTQRLYAFSVDGRPVDGNYERISVRLDAEGTYVAEHRVITAGFGFPVSDTTTEIASGLACEATKEGRRLAKLFCSIDLRPADGELKELTVIRGEDGLYEATLRRAVYATLITPEADVTETLVSGLKRIN